MRHDQADDRQCKIDADRRDRKVAPRACSLGRHEIERCECQDHRELDPADEVLAAVLLRLDGLLDPLRQSRCMVAGL